MKKCPYNVSSKSYEKFVSRIESVARDEDSRRRLIAAMQLYLMGYTDECMKGLDGACRMAFGMLRFELDEAMRRSGRARERARRRKAAEAGEVLPETQVQDDCIPDAKTRRRESAGILAQSLEAEAREMGVRLPAGTARAMAEAAAGISVMKPHDRRGPGSRRGKLRWRAIS